MFLFYAKSKQPVPVPENLELSVQIPTPTPTAHIKIYCLHLHYCIVTILCVHVSSICNLCLCMWVKHSNHHIFPPIIECTLKTLT